MDKIKELRAREILDSRGNPTLEVDCILESGAFGRAAVPSGASTGTYEALELRDGEKERYFGKGVKKAIQNVMEKIQPKICGLDPVDQRKIDRLLIQLDGTKNKSHLGANALLGVSLAVAHAAAKSKGVPLYRSLGGEEARTLPVPMMNIINGGVHADNFLTFQEFMLVPGGASRFSEALRMGSEIFHSLKDLLKKKGHRTNVGDEGGFAPDLKTHEEAIEAILDSGEKAGYRGGKDFYISLDVAASEFYQKEDRIYKLKISKSTIREKNSEEMIQLYGKLLNQYPLLSIEDGLAEEDWEGWKNLTQAFGKKIRVIGDDLFVTNIVRLERGIREKSANAILVKPNQIGTLTETLDCIQRAKDAGFVIVISHRSGETEDTTIADLAVATNIGLIKTGSLSRSERIAKYNRLLRIEEELGKRGHFPGLSAFSLQRSS